MGEYLASRTAFVAALTSTLACGSCASREDPARSLPTDTRVDATPGASIVDAAAGPEAAVLEGSASDAEESLPPIDMTGPIGGSRPADVKLPDGYDATKKHPLIVLLHGYGATGSVQDFYLGVSREALPRGYLVALPNGTADSTGQQFWNATDACCDLESRAPDDVGYIRDLVRQIVARYAVDPGRVYLVGHSNGAFLSLRLACEQSKRFAAVAALAGATWSDQTRCTPDSPIGVLTIHGTADATISYKGGTLTQKQPAKSVMYPSAESTIATFAYRNGCGTTPMRDSKVDYVADLVGAETAPLRYDSCTSGGSAELWSLDGAGHVPAFGSAFMPAVLTFFERHARR